MIIEILRQAVPVVVFAVGVFSLLSLSSRKEVRHTHTLFGA